MRLGVVKQSFFGLPVQYGRRVTWANERLGDEKQLSSLLVNCSGGAHNDKNRSFNAVERTKPATKFTEMKEAQVKDLNLLFSLSLNFSNL